MQQYRATYFLISTILLATLIGCETTQSKSSNSTPKLQPTNEKVIDKNTQLAQQYESIVQSRDRLLSKNYLGGRGFSLVESGIKSLMQLYRRAGIFGYQSQLSREQRKSLMLIQLEAITLALHLERYYMANMGKIGNEGVAREAYSIAQLATTKYPRRWPNYSPPRVTIAESKRLNAISNSYQGTQNPYFDDPAVLARSGYILIVQSMESGTQRLLKAIKIEPNDIHVRAVGALISQPGSDTERTLLSGLPDRTLRENRTLRSVESRTQKTAAFWKNAENLIVDTIRARFEYEAMLRENGICGLCEGGKKVRRTTNTVNGYSIVTASHSRIIDCPSCGGTGKR